MSDTIGSDRGVGPRTADQPARRAVHQNVREAYSFACMNCGYGWEQSYEIEHHTDTAGRPYVTYLADGSEVPSPLTRPSCGNCDGHHVRIMRSGQVSEVVARRWTVEHAERGGHRTRHWPTLHFLHRKPRGHDNPGARGVPEEAEGPGGSRRSRRPAP